MNAPDGPRPRVRASSRRREWPEFFASALLWLLILLCCGLPIVWIVSQVVMHPGALVESRLSAFRLRLVGRTLLYNGGVAGLATLLGFPAALVIGRGRGKSARVMALVLPLTLLLPSITYAYGWKQMLRLAGIDLVPASSGDVLRCIWSLATWLWAVPAGLIGLSLRNLDASVQQQALLDGAYWRFTLRQLAVPIAASMAIVLTLAMQEFVVYEPTGISVIATEVRTVFETGAIGSNSSGIQSVRAGSDTEEPAMTQPQRAALAVATALPMLAIVAALAAATLAAARGASAAGSINAGAWPSTLDTGRGLLVAAVGVLLLTVGVPVIALLASRQRPMDIIQNYRVFAPKVWGTLLVGVMAGAIALLLGALAAVAGRRAGPFSLALGSFLIGGQLIAIAQIRLYNSPSWTGALPLPPDVSKAFGEMLSSIGNGPGIVLMAYMARFGWMALAAGRTTWSKPWRELRDMAAIDGAGAVDAALYVIAPLAWPVLVAAGVLVMILSMTEVPATVLINPLRPEMFIPILMTWLHALRSDDMIDGSLMLMLLSASLGAVVLALGIRARRAWRETPASAVLLLLALAICFAGGCGRAGKPEAVWLETGAGPCQVVYPRGITYDRFDDSYFVVDRHARVQHLTHDGEFINDWRMPEWAQGKPVGLAMGPDKNLWVPDTHYNRVVVFSPDGKLLKSFGKYGRGHGEFIYPTDIAFDDKGHIFVSEYGDNDRVQVFDQSFNYLYEFGKFGQGNGEFARPQAMLIEGNLMYITDACNHRICVFTLDGKWVRNMGHVGSGPGEFRFPYGLATDADGHLIVAEFGNNRVQQVDKQTGKGLGTWGCAGRDPGQLAYPWGVCVNKRDRVVVVDAGNNRLQMFEF